MTTADLWDRRARELGPLAGTRDRIAKELEKRVIASYVRPMPGKPYEIHDYGCGDGETLRYIAARHPAIEWSGTDVSREMIELAKRGLVGPLGEFTMMDALALGTRSQAWRRGRYDLVYTERLLINLPDWETQKRAIQLILDTVKPGGLYVMDENFVNPVRRLNVIRETLGLPAIVPPEHNRYLDENECAALNSELHSDMHLMPGEAFLADRRNYSDAYYFLSRVVNAYDAARRGEEPDYGSPINQIALQLPDDLSARWPNVGQGQCWVWRKADA